MKFHDKLRLYLDTHGMKQAELARRSGYSTSRISRLVAGSGAPTLENLVRVARALELPIEFLADDEMEELPSAEEMEEIRMFDRIVAEMGRAEIIRRLLGLPAGRPPEVTTPTRADVLRMRAEKKRPPGGKGPLGK